jgi:hypothetical protein
LAAVYGPNNDDLPFYDLLERDILSMKNESIIAGGDWNATLDPSGIEHNLDAINMRKFLVVAVLKRLTPSHAILMFRTRLGICIR